MPVCVCVCACVCLSVSLCAFDSVCVCLCVSVRLLSVYCNQPNERRCFITSLLSICLSIYLFLSLSLPALTWPNACLSFALAKSDGLSVCVHPTSTAKAATTTTSATSTYPPCSLVHSLTHSLFLSFSLLLASNNLQTSASITSGYSNSRQSSGRCQAITFSAADTASWSSSSA